MNSRLVKSLQLWDACGGWRDTCGGDACGGDVCTVLGRRRCDADDAGVPAADAFAASRIAAAEERVQAALVPAADAA